VDTVLLVADACGLRWVRFMGEEGSWGEFVGGVLGLKFLMRFLA
jgi:hypothetical protein